jgi:hypothetical protein
VNDAQWRQLGDRLAERDDLAEHPSIQLLVRADVGYLLLAQERSIGSAHELPIHGELNALPPPQDESS